MRTKRMTVQKLTATAAGLAVWLVSPAAFAADDQGWLCKYLPKYCASDDDPGGLPGHSQDKASESDSLGASRGLTPDDEEAKPAAPAPAAAPPTPPETEKKP